MKAPASLPRLGAPGGKPKCSAALGYLDVNSIVTAADTALYAAKGSGRNRVVKAEGG